MDLSSIHQVVIAILIVCSYLLWMLPNSKCVCDKCAFHANERRMKALRKAEEAERYKADQAALRHEYEHKGGGFMPSDPDRFSCSDDACPRNGRKS